MPWNRHYKGSLGLEVHSSTYQARHQLAGQLYGGDGGQYFVAGRQIPGNSGIAYASWCNSGN
jgi:hypothetical protein